MKKIVWIVLDALRYDALMTYVRDGGFSFLPEDTAIFTSAESQGSWTYPSFFSFLSGRYPFNCGVSSLEEKDGLPVSHCGEYSREISYVFDYLQAAGIGCRSLLDKWMTTLDYAVEKKANIKMTGREFFEERWRQHPKFQSREIRNASPGKMLELAKGEVKDGPQFLFFRLMDLHDSGILADYIARKGEGGIGWLMERYHDVLRQVEEGLIQPLLEYLGEDCIFIFHSDHGDTIPGDYFAIESYGHAGYPLGPLTRVPLIISGMGLKGMEDREVMLLDILPTLLGHLGIKHSGLDGRDIREIEKPRTRYADSAGFRGGVSLLAGDLRVVYSPELGGARAFRTESGYERQFACVSAWEIWQWFKMENRVPLAGETGPGVLEEKLKALGYL